MHGSIREPVSAGGIMSSSVTKLYVGNLSESVTSKHLKELFGNFGQVDEVAVLRGFGFVVSSTTPPSTPSPPSPSPPSLSAFPKGFRRIRRFKVVGRYGVHGVAYSSTGLRHSSSATPLEHFIGFSQ